MKIDDILKLHRGAVATFYKELTKNKKVEKSA